MRNHASVAIINEDRKLSSPILPLLRETHIETDDESEEFPGREPLSPPRLSALPITPQITDLTESVVRMVADHNPVPMWIVDDETFRFLYVNHAFHARYGYSQEEMHDMTIYDIRGPEERLRLSLLLHSHKAPKGGSYGYWNHQTKEGKHLWVEVFTQKVFFEGRFARLVTAPEVTQQVKGWEEQNEYLAALQASEQQSRESAENLSLILEEMSDAFFVLDTEGRFTFINHNAEAFLRRNREELIGKTIWQEFPQMIRSSFISRYQAAFFEGQTQHFEKYFRSIATWFEIHIYPLNRGVSSVIYNDVSSSATETAGLSGVSVFFRDITARKIAEAAEARSAKERSLFALQQRHFLREVLFSVTEGGFRLCVDSHDLPEPVGERWCTPIALTQSAELSLVRQQVREAAITSDFAPEHCYDLVSAASEGAMNAIQHGKTTLAPAIVDIFVAADQSEIQVWISDRGQGIQLNELPRATLLRGHSTAGTLGHGFHLMLQSVDLIYLLTGPEGTTIVLRQFKEAPVFDALHMFSPANS